MLKIGDAVQINGYMHMIHRNWVVTEVFADKVRLTALNAHSEPTGFITVLHSRDVTPVPHIVVSNLHTD